MVNESKGQTSADSQSAAVRCDGTQCDATHPAVCATHPKKRAASRHESTPDTHEQRVRR
jgi:hypothetical protein